MSPLEWGVIAKIVAWVSESTPVKFILDRIGSQGKEKRDADKEVFIRLEKIMCEKDFNRIIQELVNLQTHSSSKDIIREYIQAMGEISNQFHDKKTEKLKGALASSLDELMEYVAGHFFTHPPDQTNDDLILYLEPHKRWNQTSENIELFNQCVTELDVLVKDSRDKYGFYRKRIKVSLHI